MSDGMLFALCSRILNTLELEKFQRLGELGYEAECRRLRLSGSVGTGSDSH